MSSPTRSAILKGLRSAAQFEIPEQTLEGCLTPISDFVRDPERIASTESVIRAAVLGYRPIPKEQIPRSLPILGNIAESTVESMLVDHGWQPVYDDTAGVSFGHGVDLLMLDPTLDRVVAIEVKSTIQPARWPRLPRGRNEQLTPGWFNHPGNQGMFERELADSDIYVMVAQVHFGRRLWRSCIARDVNAPRSITATGQLEDLSWLS